MAQDGSNRKARRRAKRHRVKARKKRRRTRRRRGGKQEAQEARRRAKGGRGGRAEEEKEKRGGLRPTRSHSGRKEALTRGSGTHFSCVRRKWSQMVRAWPYAHVRFSWKKWISG